MAENAVAVKMEAPVVPVSNDGAVILSIIDRMASNPDMPVEKIERMLDMHERMQKEVSRKAYHAGLALLQADIPTVVALGRITGEDKGTGNKITRSKYAKWEDVNEAIRPSLCKHGFALSFRITQPQPDRVSVTAVLSHREGHSEETSLHLPNDPSGGKNNVQAWGSSVSYGKRYTAFAMLNIAARGEDDDAKAAGSVETISEDEEMALREYAESVGTNLPAFCQYFKIAKLSDLPKSELGRANAALKKKATAQ